MELYLSKHVLASFLSPCFKKLAGISKHLSLTKNDAVKVFYKEYEDSPKKELFQLLKDVSKLPLVFFCHRSYPMVLMKSGEDISNKKIWEYCQPGTEDFVALVVT